MYYTQKSTSGGEDVRPNTMKPQNEKRNRSRCECAQAKLTEEFCQLLNTKGTGRWRWKGTTTDLLEAAYRVYLSNSVRNRQGCPCTFRHIADEICKKLQRTLPNHPTSYVYRAQHRKGVRRESFFTRYCWIWEHEDPEQPLMHFVAAEKSPQL